jgi:hypothetical protein
MGWLSSLYGPASAMLIGVLLSMLVAGAGWMWRKPAEKNLARTHAISQALHIDENLSE